MPKNIKVHIVQKKKYPNNQVKSNQILLNQIKIHNSLNQNILHLLKKLKNKLKNRVNNLKCNHDIDNKTSSRYKNNIFMMITLSKYT